MRTLLLLAVPTALLACFLKLWLPWLNPGLPDARPSAFFSSLDRNQLDNMFRQLVPKAQMFSATRSRSSANEVSAQTGKWKLDWNASLVCYPAEADRALRTLRADLQNAVKRHGGQIRDEQERLDGSSLVGFRFVYIEGEHTGTVTVTYGPEKPFGAFPDVDPPFRTLRIGIEESTGFGREVPVNEIGESPETASSTGWQAKR